MRNLHGHAGCYDPELGDPRTSQSYFGSISDSDLTSDFGDTIGLHLQALCFARAFAYCSASFG